MNQNRSNNMVQQTTTSNDGQSRQPTTVVASSSMQQNSRESTANGQQRRNQQIREPNLENEDGSEVGSDSRESLNNTIVMQPITTTPNRLVQSSANIRITAVQQQQQKRGPKPKVTKSMVAVASTASDVRITRATAARLAQQQQIEGGQQQSSGNLATQMLQRQNQPPSSTPMTTASALSRLKFAGVYIFRSERSFAAIDAS